MDGGRILGLCRWVNFSDVVFMSRSFADEFHKQKMKLIDNLNDIIHIANAPKKVIEILQAVSKTQSNRNLNNQKIPVSRFSNE